MKSSEVPNSKFISNVAFSRIELANQFHMAHPDTLFPENVIAAVLGCSKALLQRQRWQHSSIPFVRLGRSIRYQKSSVVAWINQNQPFNSTSQYAHQAQGGINNEK